MPRPCARETKRYRSWEVAYFGGTSASINHQRNKINRFFHFNYLRIRIRLTADRAGIGLSRKAAPTGAVFLDNLMGEPIIIIQAVVAVLAALLQ
jgi:hypothetical protein